MSFTLSQIIAVEVGPRGTLDRDHGSPSEEQAGTFDLGLFSHQHLVGDLLELRLLGDSQ